jgi:hypothetical protein
MKISEQMKYNDDDELSVGRQGRQQNAVSIHTEAPFTSQNISSATRHIESLDPCMEH